MRKEKTSKCLDACSFVGCVRIFIRTRSVLDIYVCPIAVLQELLAFTLIMCGGVDLEPRVGKFLPLEMV